MYSTTWLNESKYPLISVSKIYLSKFWCKTFKKCSRRVPLVADTLKCPYYIPTPLICNAELYSHQCQNLFHLKGKWDCFHNYVQFWFVHRLSSLAERLLSLLAAHPKRRWEIPILEGRGKGREGVESNASPVPSIQLENLRFGPFLNAVQTEGGFGFLSKSVLTFSLWEHLRGRQWVLKHSSWLSWKIAVKCQIWTEVDQ